MTDEGIDQVLAEIRAVAGELVEIKADLKNATAHIGDVDLLRADIESMKKHLKKIDEFMAGPPALQERLAALERKQEREHQEDSAGVTTAGTADDPAHRKSSRSQADEAVGESEARQEEVNVEFRSGLGRVERAIFDILHADLKKSASIILAAVGVAYVLSRIVG